MTELETNFQALSEALNREREHPSRGSERPIVLINGDELARVNESEAF